MSQDKSITATAAKTRNVVATALNELHFYAVGICPKWLAVGTLGRQKGRCQKVTWSLCELRSIEVSVRW